MNQTEIRLTCDECKKITRSSYSMCARLTSSFRTESILILIVHDGSPVTACGKTGYRKGDARRSIVLSLRWYIRRRLYLRLRRLNQSLTYSRHQQLNSRNKNSRSEVIEIMTSIVF
jgi:hypothetical protein